MALMGLGCLCCYKDGSPTGLKFYQVLNFPKTDKLTIVRLLKADSNAFRRVIFRKRFVFVQMV